MRPEIKRPLRCAVSLALAVSVLAVLLGRQEWDRFAEHLRDAEFRMLAFAAVLAVVYWSVRVARWRWMTVLESQRVGWPRAWLSMLAGLGVGLITPMRIGEVVRPMFLPRGARLRLAGWVVIERMFDLAAVLTLGILGLFYAIFSGVAMTTETPVSPWLLLAAPLLLAAALALPLLVRYRPAGLWRIIGRVLPEKARQLAEVRLTWRQFGIFFAVSFAAETICLFSVFFCLRAYGPISLITATALAPVVVFGNLLPAGPGGFGLREGAAVLIFGALGFSEPMVLAAYISQTLIVLVIPSAAGVAAAFIAEITGPHSL